MINIGPIITFSLLWLYRFNIYNYCLTSDSNLVKEKYLKEKWEPTLCQDIAFKMGLGHFVKRFIECIFVHYYSKPTKSLNKIVREIGFYWLFFGILVPFYLLHPLYTPEAFWQNWISNDSLFSVKYLYYILTSIFILAEIMNLLCHMHLKSFRKGDHDYTRMIPRFHGYSFITSANYFWEFIAWLSFAFVA